MSPMDRPSELGVGGGGLVDDGVSGGLGVETSGGFGRAVGVGWFEVVVCGAAV